MATAASLRACARLNFSRRFCSRLFFFDDLPPLLAPLRAPIVADIVLLLEGLFRLVLASATSALPGEVDPKEDPFWPRLFAAIIIIIMPPALPGEELPWPKLVLDEPEESKLFEIEGVAGGRPWLLGGDPLLLELG